MAKEEMLMKLSLLEQQARQVEGQIQQVDGQIGEIEVLKNSLLNLGKEKGSEILAPVGKGIFAKSELKEDKFFVNVGAGIFLKKNPEQAVEIIDEQIERLKSLRLELIEAISKINEELNKVVQEAQKNEKAKK